MLIITGLGQLPLYTRYNVTKLPGALWLGDYFVTINLHYLSAFGLLFAAAFHIFYAFARREFDIFPRKGDMKESYLIIKAMFTGSIKREYVKHRHSLRYSKLLKSGQISEIDLDESTIHSTGTDFIKKIEKQSDVGKSASM